jgi:saccharopine dehydrogenase (NADP+, L-glutamate forming)
LVDIGFLSEDPKDFLKEGEKRTWRDATAKIVGASSDKDEDIISAISSRTKFASAEEKNRIITGLRWIGLLSDELITPRGNPLDTLCATLEQKMQYEEGERDFLMLQHKFEIENKDGSRVIRTSTLADYGDPKGYSAMAKLVGVPCAIAVQQVLDGTLSEKGILAPMSPEICRPLLKTLEEQYGVRFREKTVPA